MIFYTLAETKILIEAWRCHYSAVKPTARSVIGHWPGNGDAAKAGTGNNALTINANHAVGGGRGAATATERHCYPKMEG